MITVLELREMLQEFINAVELHEIVMIENKASGQYKKGEWNNRNALETHLRLCDDIKENIPFTDYMHPEFMDWLESVTYKVDYSLQDLEYFTHLCHHLDLVIEYGYGDHVVEK